MKKSEQEMTEGYRDGKSDTRDDLPESLTNRSHCYRHGWQMGRDDRVKPPYDPFRASRNRVSAFAAEVLDREAGL